MLLEIKLSFESCSLISILNFGDEVRTNFLKHQQCKVLAQRCVCCGVENDQHWTRDGEFIAERETLKIIIIIIIVIII